MPQPSKLIGLAEMIEKVKAELLSTADPRKSGAPVFFVESVELELQVTAQNEAGAGIKIGVIPFSPIKGEAGFNAGVSYENTHKVKVTLSPLYDKEKILAWQQLYEPEQEAKSLDASRKATLKGSEANLADRS